ISSPQFSTARRAAAPGPVAPSAITASLAHNLSQSDAVPQRLRVMYTKRSSRAAEGFDGGGRVRVSTV
ncbi:MAG: hypothetical protein K2L57_05125, partial [Muribaculaceae bacterium]|nr:hypothetical protein [Muribaculaceae bacterium]